MNTQTNRTREIYRKGISRYTNFANLCLLHIQLNKLIKLRYLTFKISTKIFGALYIPLFSIREQESRKNNQKGTKNYV